jgi:hypothetical protein
MTVHVTAPMLAAYDHFTRVGFTENGAGAAVGNFCQESGEFLIATMFRAHPDYSGGVPDALKSGGIAEWLGERKTAYIAFSGRAEARLGLAKGSLVNDLGTQCDFVVYELRTNPSYETLYQWLTTGSRSIANLTANFMMVYERPKLGPTANLDNRIAHAEAVVARAKALKSAPTAPQPAPSAPVPQVPVPPAPPIVLPVPTAPAGLPPISASDAGFDAAILDNIGAWHDALLNQRAEIDRKIAALEAAATAFGKVEPMIIPAYTPTMPGGNARKIVLPKPAADPATVIQPRSQSVFGIVINWKTTISGLIAAGAQVFAAAYPQYATIAQTISGLAMGALGLSAKDANVTGGTKSNVTGVLGTPVSLVDRESHR